MTSRAVSTLAGALSGVRVERTPFKRDCLGLGQYLNIICEPAKSGWWLACDNLEQWYSMCGEFVQPRSKSSCSVSGTQRGWISTPCSPPVSCYTARPSMFIRKILLEPQGVDTCRCLGKISAGRTLKLPYEVSRSNILSPCDSANNTPSVGHY